MSVEKVFNDPFDEPAHVHYPPPSEPSSAGESPAKPREEGSLPKEELQPTKDGDPPPCDAELGVVGPFTKAYARSRAPGEGESRNT